MEEYLLALSHESIAIFIIVSILMNMIIAVSGILPSAFITAANITILGFQGGFFVSVAGEALGAIVAFVLYRKGIKKVNSKVKLENKLLNKLKDTVGWKAVFIVILLRVIPFIPSGVVTLTAAFSRMGLLSYAIASTLGKVPSLIIEAYSIDSFLKLNTQWQIWIIAIILAISFIYFWISKRS
jgi:uncharacterized membrane protein YdjX (TVP38/TMEM64 family)